MASKYLKKFPVPEQFPEILHDFAREILRDQPEDILDYGFQYFKAMSENSTFDYKNKGKNIPPEASRRVQDKAPTGPKQEEKPKEEPKKEETETKAEDKKEEPQSRVSSAKTNEKEAKKYVNDMIEKLSQDDSDEEKEGEKADDKKDEDKKE